MSAPTELHSAAFEDAICGVLMVDPHCWGDIEETGIQARDFYQPTRGRLFSWLVERITAGLPVELHVLAEELMQRADRASFPGVIAISNMGDQPCSLTAPHYARQVVKLAFQRRGRASLARLDALFARPDLTDTDLLAETERTLQGMANGQAGDDAWITGNDLASLMLADIDARIEARRTGGVVGLPWGIDDLDNAPADAVTGEPMAFPPLQPGRMYLVAARPAMGKSSLVLQMLQNRIAAGDAVGLFNLEMEADGVGRKLIALATGLPTGLLRDGAVCDADYRRARAGLAAMSQWPLYLDTTPAQTIERIASKARRLASRLRHTDTPLTMIMVDYAQLLRSEGDNTQDRLAAVSQGLLALSKELQVPVVALAQLNRKCEERTDKRPQLADLRGSGQWEQDAHAILFLYREAYYDDLCGHDDTEVIVAKWRDHRTGIVRTRWNASTQRFGDPRPRLVSQ